MVCLVSCPVSSPQVPRSAPETEGRGLIWHAGLIPGMIPNKPCDDLFITYYGWNFVKRYVIGFFAGWYWISVTWLVDARAWYGYQYQAQESTNHVTLIQYQPAKINRHYVIGWFPGIILISAREISISFQGSLYGIGPISAIACDK